MWGMVRDELESVNRAFMQYCTCHSKKLVLDPREHSELQKTYFQTSICIGSDEVDELEVIRLVAREVVTELFVRKRKHETLKLGGCGNEIRK